MDQMIESDPLCLCAFVRELFTNPIPGFISDRRTNPRFPRKEALMNLICFTPGSKELTTDKHR